MRRSCLPAMTDKDHLLNQAISSPLCFQRDIFTNKEAAMTLQLSGEGTIADVQDSFNKEYPYLRIDFFRLSEGRLASAIRQKLPRTTPLRSAGIQRDGELDISSGLTVAALESAFKSRFKANVQVCRKSGSIWLETTMTDSWTLKQQNDHGRELSEPNQLSVAKAKTDLAAGNE